MGKERPILFSAPMVRAILAGTKTVTRRTAKPSVAAIANEGIVGDRLCPYGVPGDRLWVRETWQKFDPDRDPIGPDRFGPACPNEGVCDDGPIRWRAVYRADGDLTHPEHGDATWRPSIFMPRWASRITLEVVSVRVERLQEIDELDSLAEGIIGEPAESMLNDTRGVFIVGSARDAYAKLWDEINGERAPWSSNPWVWRVEFKRTTTPHREGKERE